MIIPALAQDPCLLTKTSLEGGAGIRPLFFTVNPEQWNRPYSIGFPSPEEVATRAFWPAARASSRLQGNNCSASA